jgi:hypothetical protein
VLLTLGLCTGSVLSDGQTNYTIGTGTTTNLNWEYPSPFGDYYESTRQQFLYTAAEAAAAGMTAGSITAIKWNVTALNGTGAHEQFTIKIGTTSVASLSLSGWETVNTVVYGPATYQPVAGINTFSFPSPFAWNGTDNLIVEVCGGDANNTNGDYYTYNPGIAYTIVPFNGSRTLSYDDLGNVCGSNDTLKYHQNSTRRPNITFVMGSSSTVCQPPTGVTLSSVTGSGATASWTAPAGVTNFQYMVNQNTAAPSGTGTAVSGNTLPIGSLSAGTTYYFHLRSVCSGSTFSNWVTVPLTTSAGPLCDAPAGITTAVVTASSVTLTWGGVTGATGYEYTVLMGATPPAVGMITNVPKAAKGNLIGGTTYYAHIRTKCGTNYSAWTSKSFNTVATTIEHVKANGSVVSIFPNPASAYATLHKRDDKAGMLVLTDLSGRLLKELKVKGETSSIDLSELANGFYFIRYSNGETSEVIKLHKQ